MQPNYCIDFEASSLALPQGCRTAALRTHRMCSTGAGRGLGLSVVLVVCLISSLLSAEPISTDITFRFVNPNSGEPVKNLTVFFTAWNVDRLPPRASEIVARATIRTDKEGKAVFHLPQPIPKHLEWNAFDIRGCSDKDYSAEQASEALRIGFVANYDPGCGKLKTQIGAKPGEIVILDRPLTLLERITREIP